MSLPGLLSSVAVIVHSLVFSPGSKSSSASSSTTSSNRSTDVNFAASPQRIFVSGMVTGIGIFWIVNWQRHNFRLIERLRLALWNSIRGKSDQNDNSTTPASSSSNGNDVAVNSTTPKVPAQTLRHRPVLLQQLEPMVLAVSKPTSTAEGTTPATSAEGQRVVVVSPFTAPTSALSMVLLTLPPGTQLAKSVARGVECYYVLQGHGLCHVIEHRTASVKESNLNPGQGWVVDPGRTRWISNPSSSSSDLIVLRASDDGGWKFETIDCIVPTQSLPSTSLVSTAADMLASGLKQVECMVKTYRVVKETSKS